MDKHLRLKVTGKVQGVWYRDSTRSIANELGLKGYVRNEPDGSVWIEAEGRPEALKALIDWCRQGPPQADVQAVETEEGEWKGYTNFEIRR